MKLSFSNWLHPPVKSPFPSVCEFVTAPRKPNSIFQTSRNFQSGSRELGWKKKHRWNRNQKKHEQCKKNWLLMGIWGIISRIPIFPIIMECRNGFERCSHGNGGYVWGLPFNPGNCSWVNPQWNFDVKGPWLAIRDSTLFLCLGRTQLIPCLNLPDVSGSTISTPCKWGVYICLYIDILYMSELRFVVGVHGFSMPVNAWCHSWKPKID